ncbi:hypothetical protein [Clostridium hydrogeniformans]|uniref:hypothetical protein n=1 Tax=Clostridium hydrogeniformans TaxID=349933 RepID=UPI000484EDDB|nr:hypothetical protein [Clostridium hydrogeniformans]
MKRRSCKNNDLLNKAREVTTPKVYSLVTKLVNDEMEDMAEVVLKVDYLLTYVNSAIKSKDIKVAKDSLNIIRKRLDILSENQVDINHLEGLYNDMMKSIK